MEEDYTGNDFYCDIAIPRKIPLEIVHEDTGILAFHHTRPYWPVHIVVVPKNHVVTLTGFAGLNQKSIVRLMERVYIIADQVMRKHGAARILTNLGGYQDSKHLHFHISYGKPFPH